MSYPEFYDPQKVGQFYIPNTPQAVEAGRRANISNSEEDKRRVVLLLVDCQVDFIHEDGALSVPGAVNDTRRIIEWIFAHTNELTTVAASLDSHVPIQIFSPTWWVNKDGEHPAPFTTISSEDVQSGKWTPLYEVEWSRMYVEKLEEMAKKQLMIWPYHCLIGTPGHNLVPPLYEAIAYHTAARQSQPIFLTKGTVPKTEHYSILEPEVKVPDQPHGGLNTDFLNMLATYDLIYVAGQAKSHCVLETVSSMMRYFALKPEFIDKMRILCDAMSSVAHPEIDFDGMANEAFKRFADNGLRLVTTQDPIG
jgi:nicotinamidase-related amidase